MTAHTPVYGLEYITEGEPLRDARLALENNAHTIEDALIRGGIAPPAASDLATLSGRVTALETVETPTAWTALPIVGAPYLAHYTLNPQAGSGGGSGPTQVQYRIVNRRLWLRGWATSAGGYAVGGGTGANPLLTTVLPVAARPPVTATLNVPTSAGTLMRHEVSPAGQMNAALAVPANTFLCFDGLSWSLT